MSTTLGFSDFEPNNDNNNDNKNSNRKAAMRNRTQKNRTMSSGSSSRVESMLKQINNDIFNPNSSHNQDAGSNLEDFTPPPKPLSSGVERMRERDNHVQQTNDSDVKIEGFNDMENGNEWNQDYYQQWMPMYTQAASGNSGNNGNSELIEKLNYMIHLLEEDREVKQGNVTEEVVLYCFLGVFVIFVVDSFAKVGKYVR